MNTLAQYLKIGGHFTELRRACLFTREQNTAFCSREFLLIAGAPVRLWRKGDAVRVRAQLKASVAHNPRRRGQALA